MNSIDKPNKIRNRNSAKMNLQGDDKGIKTPSDSSEEDEEPGNPEYGEGGFQVGCKDESAFR